MEDYINSLILHSGPTLQWANIQVKVTLFAFGTRAATNSYGCSKTINDIKKNIILITVLIKNAYDAKNSSKRFNYKFWRLLLRKNQHATPLCKHATPLETLLTSGRHFTFSVINEITSTPLFLICRVFQSLCADDGPSLGGPKQLYTF